MGKILCLIGVFKDTTKSTIMNWKMKLRNPVERETVYLRMIQKFTTTLDEVCIAHLSRREEEWEEEDLREELNDIFFRNNTNTLSSCFRAVTGLILSDNPPSGDDFISWEQLPEVWWQRPVNEYTDKTGYWVWDKNTIDNLSTASIQKRIDVLNEAIRVCRQLKIYM